MNKTIIVVPGATQQELERMTMAFKDGQHEILLLNKETKMYHLIDGEYFEVVSELKKVEVTVIDDFELKEVAITKEGFAVEGIVKQSHKEEKVEE